MSGFYPKKLLIFGLIIGIPSCHQSSGELGTCLKSVSRADKYTLKRQGEIGGQLFFDNDDAGNKKTEDATDGVTLRGTTELTDKRSLASLASRPYCNSYLEFVNPDEDLNGTEAEITVYTARHCIHENSLKSASIKLNTTKSTVFHSLKRVAYKEVPVRFAIVEAFNDAKGVLSEEQFTYFYNEFNIYRSFGLSDHVASLKNLDVKNHPRVKSMLADLSQEKAVGNAHFCAPSGEDFDYENNHQKVCMLPGDLAVFRATIAIDPEDKDSLRGAIKKQSELRAKFSQANTAAKNASLDAWKKYIQGLNNDAARYAKEKTLHDCKDTCPDIKKSTAIPLREATRLATSDEDNVSPKINTEFDDQFLDHVEKGLDQWSRLKIFVADYKDVFVQSNFEHERLSAPQFLSFPMSKIPIDKAHDIQFDFASYGITYESDDAAISFQPGDSGSLISIGGQVPIAVVSLVNGVRTSSGIQLPRLPPRINNRINDDIFNGQTGAPSPSKIPTNTPAYPSDVGQNSDVASTQQRREPPFYYPSVSPPAYSPSSRAGATVQDPKPSSSPAARGTASIPERPIPQQGIETERDAGEITGVENSGGEIATPDANNTNATSTEGLSNESLSSGGC
jgi:hypothetical protein